MTRYAVGDIHGRLDEFRRILDLIRADALQLGINRPSIVCLGDYVDRGPDSRGVLDLLTSDDLTEWADPIFLRGNHDAALHSIISQGEDPMTWLQLGGADCIESYGVVIGSRPPPIFMKEFHELFPMEHLNFLSQLKVMHKADGFLFTHAGLDPFVPADDERKQRTAMIWGHHKFPDHTDDYGVRVVHGHWATKQVVIRPNRIGVDTGCGFPGGRLSAVALNRNEIRIIG